MNKPNEERFPPRLLVTHRAFSGFQVSRLDNKIDKIHFEGTYVHLAEHQHILAEKEKRIERLREALKFYSVASNYVDSIETDETGVIFVGIRVAEDRGRLARAALQEETK